ncbi:MAG: coenzyme F420-0:L-glutamate ligase [Candidatus Saccharimonadales bacterium]
MNITSIRTRVVTANTISLTDLLDESIESFEENSVIVITSKIISLCENAVVPMSDTNREDLIKREADLYLPKTISRYGHHFSIKYNTLIASAGIDESNGNGDYILWPRDPWNTAENVRLHLQKRFDVKNIGVVISDSTCQPLRRGTIGTSIAHSGFIALRNYIGKPDIFGRTINMTSANVTNALASAAVVMMGEGNEQTPIAVLSDLSFIDFVNRRPTPEEITDLNIPLHEDLFAPFLETAEWQQGQGGN